MTERELERGTREVSDDALYRGWRERHPNLVYVDKRWVKPGRGGGYAADQVPYGAIMTSISEHVERVLGEYDSLRVRAVYETALVECRP